MKKLYSGSCHCGALRFRALLDLAPPAERSPPSRDGIWWMTTFRCNCSYCSKMRYWKAFVPASDFEWISNREDAAIYQFGPREIDHYFCKTCGAQTFARSSLEQLGGEFYCVNIACLDNASDSELANAPIAYEDGREDEWTRAPSETRHM